MKVLVCGGREYWDAYRVFTVLDALHREVGITKIVNGDAPGADRLSSLWAVLAGIAVDRYPALWEKDGRRAAGPIRNQRMLDQEQPDMVVAFPGGTGTADMVRKARRAGVTTREVDMMDIFVFGSNLAGRHGKGSAKYALMNYGAVYGIGVGFQGSSYAIPTKDANLKPLPLERIERYVEEFLAFARKTPFRTFKVVKIGCGLAGYTDADISPMFRGAPSNVILPEGWGGECRVESASGAHERAQSRSNA